MRKPLKKIPLVILAVILGLGLVSGLAWAGSSPNSAITWQVLASGGQPAANSSGLSLNGTLGQPLSGSTRGGDVALKAGYWARTQKPYVIYFPIMSRVMSRTRQPYVFYFPVIGR